MIHTGNNILLDESIEHGINISKLLKEVGLGDHDD